MILLSGTWWLVGPCAQNAQCGKCGLWFLVHGKVGDGWVCSGCAGLSS